MRAYLTIILIGLVSAFIGIIPLFKRKADKYTVLSAFVLFLIMPYVVYHLSLPWTQWWWKGMIVSAVLTLPLVITSGRGSSRCAFPLLLASVVVGAFISFLGHYYCKYRGKKGGQAFPDRLTVLSLKDESFPKVDRWN